MSLDPRVEALEKRVMELESIVRTLTVRTLITDSAAINATPNGYIEIAIGGSPARLPYFSVS